MILPYLETPDWEKSDVKLFSGSIVVFRHNVDTTNFMEGGWYAV